jgi:hypothetical protein
MAVSAPPRPIQRAPHARWARSSVHAVMGVSGPVVALVPAVVAYRLGWSWTAVAVTFAGFAGLLALIIPELVVGPQRVKRAVVAAFPVGTSIAGFLIAGHNFDGNLAALVIGGLLGSAVGSGVQPMLSPALARERTERWQNRQTDRNAG